MAIGLYAQLNAGTGYLYNYGDREAGTFANDVLLVAVPMTLAPHTYDAVNKVGVSAVRQPRQLLTLYNAINALSAAQKTNIGNDLFDTSSTPTATNTTTETLTFLADPTWATGSRVTVATTGGGLTAGTSYYYRRVAATTGTIHPTLADANANTNKVNLTANVTSIITRPGRWSSNVGPNRAAMFSLYVQAQLATLSAADKNVIKIAGAAMMAQDNPTYLVAPSFDASINIPGDEPMT